MTIKILWKTPLKLILKLKTINSEESVNTTASINPRNENSNNDYYNETVKKIYR